MKLKIAIKILFRSPVRTVLSVILLSVVTFALFSQVAEYSITQREMEKAAAQYYGVGSVEADSPYMPFLFGDTGYPHHLVLTATDPEGHRSYVSTMDSTATGLYTLLTQEQIDAVSALPYISSTDTRLMTAGVSDDYYRLDDGSWFYGYSMRCVVEATVTSETTLYKGFHEGFGNVSFFADNVKMLAGYVPPIEGKESVQTTDMLTQHVFHGNTKIASPDYWAAGRTDGFTDRMAYFYIGGNEYGYKELSKLTVGRRYVFVLRFSPWGGPDGPFEYEYWPEFLLDYPEGYQYHIGDHLTDSWCNAVWPIDDEPENYLELEKYAPLRELMELIDQDSRTFDMVYTDDMETIKRFADGRMELTEGRLITREDSASQGDGAADGAVPCVVSEEFAGKNRLGVGDVISMNLGTLLFEQYVNLGAIAGTRERYAPPSVPARLEIVGIYRNTDSERARSKDPNWAYSVNAIFVPKSLLPLDPAALPPHEYKREFTYRSWPSLTIQDPYWNTFYLVKLDSHGYAPSEFSFRIDNAHDIGPFLAAAEPLTMDMGLNLMFNDRGWRYVEQGFLEVARLAVIKLTLFTASVIAATCLAVYLFIGRRKKDYAVMRALGAPKRKSARTLALPLMAVAAVSVLLGGAAACAYTISTIARNNAFVAIDKYAVDTSIPAAVVAGCALGQLLLTFIITLVMLRRIGAIQPLALLHGGAARGASRGAERTGSERNATITSKKRAASWARSGESAITPAPVDSQPEAGDPCHYESSAPLSPLPALDAQSRSSIGFVPRYIARHIWRSSVKSALAALLAALLFFAIGWISELNASYTNLLYKAANTANFTGDLTFPLLYQLTLPGYITGKYYEGLSKPVNILVSGRETGPMEMTVTNNITRFYGRSVGITYDGIHDDSTLNYFANVLVVGRGFADAYGVGPGDAIAVIPVGIGEDERLFPYNVIGVVENSDDMEVYTPGLSTRRKEERFLFETISALEVSINDDSRVEEYRTHARTAILESGEKATIIMNTASLENLRNAQRLTRMLYPMAIAASLLIGGFLCCLIILQSSKEAAIMRVLGTSQRKACAILAAEQSMLSLAGLAAGMLVMLAYKGGAPGAITDQMIQFAAFYFAMILACGIACPTLATRRPPLELMHVRE